MKLLVPKPLHGWRQFAGEVEIIVIGVLIALGAEDRAPTGVADVNDSSRVHLH